MDMNNVNIEEIVKQVLSGMTGNAPAATRESPSPRQTSSRETLESFVPSPPVYPDWSRQPRPCVRPPATSVTDTPQNLVFPYTRFSIHAFLSFFLKKPMIFLMKLVYDSLLMTAESVMAV